MLRNAHRDTLVDPVPDATALEVFVFADRVPVEGQVAVAIPHRVGVFALDERTLVSFFLLFVLGVVDATVDAHIHRTVDIGVPVENGAFILNGARRIEALEPLIGRLEVGAVPRFVAEGPDDNARMVAVAIRHALGAVHVRVEPLGGIGERVFSVAHAVRFDIRFIDDIEAVEVAEIVPARIVRIMAGANGVDVEGLHERDIFEHTFLGEGMAGETVMFMTVDALDEDGAVVDAELTVFDLDLAETDVERRVEGFFTLFVRDGEGRFVKPRGLGGP